VAVKQVGVDWPLLSRYTTGGGQTGFKYEDPQALTQPQPTLNDLHCSQQTNI